MSSIFETTSTSTVTPWEPLIPGLTAGADEAVGLLGDGAYEGPFIADYNPNQFAGIDAGIAGAGGAGSVSGAYTDAGNMLTPGLGMAQDFYSGAMGGSSNPWLTNPDQYFGLAERVADNPYMDSMIDSALTDGTRQLREGTLPGIQAGYSGDNAGHSRGMMDSSIATRGYLDRASDVGANMRGSAYQTGLGIADGVASADQKFGFDAAGAMAGLGSDGLGYLGQGYGWNQQGANDTFKWGNEAFGMDETARSANQAGFYEGWKPLEAFGNYMNPMASALNSETRVDDQGTLGPLIDIGARLLSSGLLSESDKSIWDQIGDLVSID